MEYQHATLYHELCKHVLNWSQLGIKMITLCCISTQWKWYATVREYCCIAEWLEHCRLAEEQKSLKEGPDGNWLLHSSLFCCSTEFGLCGQETCALLWRQWVCVELLMVHLITVAGCVSEDWLRIKHIWECQHVYYCILLVSLSMHSSSVYSLLYMHAEYWCDCQCLHCKAGCFVFFKAPQSESILRQSATGAHSSHLILLFLTL